MTEKKLDRWRERMVAVQCGEASAEEKRELEAALAADEELRRDWEELETARSALAELAGAAADAGSQPEPADGPWTAARESHGAVLVPLRRPWLAAAAGFAAAASLCLGLLLAGLRLDRAEGGLLMRFAGLPAPTVQAAVPAVAQRYVTREELATFAQLMVESTSARLDRLERRQTGNQAEVAKALFDAIAVTQERGFDDLRNRIELASYRPAGGRRQ